MKLGRRRLTPTEMYPAGELGMQARMVKLATGLSVRVVEAGEVTARPVLMIPGWGCPAWIFHDNIRQIADAGFRAIVVELKGHGLSDKPAEAGEYTLASIRDHVIDVIDALQLSSVAVVGHSMGAAIAGAVAAKLDDRIFALAFVAPVGFAGVRGMTLFRAITPRFMIPALPFLARRTVIRAILGLVYGPLRGATGDDIDQFWAQTQFPGFTQALRHILHEFTWNSPLQRFSAPLLVIVGTEDLLSPPDELSLFSEAGGPMRSVVIGRAGHVILDESPAHVNRVLIDFFKSAGADNYISPQNA